MTKPSHGDPKIDEEFVAFLASVDSWTTRRVDNLDAKALKKAVVKLGALQGRLAGAAITICERKIGALKGELRKKT